MVTLDSQGRLIDQDGKVIQSTDARPQASIKVNQTARHNPLLEDMQAPPPDARNNKYYDPSIGGAGHSRDARAKKAFSFVPEGHFSRKADDMRAKAAVEAMLQEASKPSNKRRAAIAALASTAAAAAGGGGGGGGSGASGAAAVSSATLERRLAEVPQVEWWDAPLLCATSYAGPPGFSAEANAVLEGISHLVEHPVPILPPAEPPPPPPMPLPLTKRERKKLRTQRRLAAEKEKQDQIRCGLARAAAAQGQDRKPDAGDEGRGGGGPVGGGGEGARRDGAARQEPRGAQPGAQAHAGGAPREEAAQADQRPEWRWRACLAVPDRPEPVGQEAVQDRHQRAAEPPDGCLVPRATDQPPRRRGRPQGAEAVPEAAHAAHRLGRGPRR